jgi:hypothetical protein
MAASAAGMQPIGRQDRQLDRYVKLTNDDYCASFARRIVGSAHRLCANHRTVLGGGYYSECKTRLKGWCDDCVICVVLGQSYLGGAQVVKVSPWSPHPSRERCEDGGGWANSRLRSVSLLEGWNRQ